MKPGRLKRKTELRRKTRLRTKKPWRRKPSPHNWPLMIRKCTRKYGRTCQKCKNEIPWYLAIVARNIHHILPRSLGGSDLIANLFLLCWTCHDWVHDNPREAKEKGFLRSR